MDKSQLRSVELSGSDIKSLLAGEMIKVTMPVLTEEQHLLGYGYDPIVKGFGFTRYLGDGEYHDILVSCPIGRATEILWVKEATYFDDQQGWFYEADHSTVELDYDANKDQTMLFDEPKQEYVGVIDAEYLPYWASRLSVEVFSVSMTKDVRLNRWVWSVEIIDSNIAKGM